MELKWIEDFVCLANLGSFWKASEERFVSQPAFSRRIRALENWLGVTLIDRSSYPVTLTPYGKQFLPHAQEILSTAHGVREEFRMVAGAAANEVRIATLHTLSIYALPKLARAFLEKRPDGRIVVIPSMQGVEHHFDALVSGAVHLLVIYGDRTITANVAQIDQLEDKVIGTDELLPVASAGFARARNLEDLSRYEGPPLPLLAYSNFSFSEKLVTPLVRGLGKRLRPVYESSLSESLKAMALAHAGVAWLPRSTIEAELERGDLVALGRPALSIAVEVKAYRLKTSASRALGALWETL